MNPHRGGQADIKSVEAWVAANTLGNNVNEEESFAGDFSGTMVTVLPGCSFTHFHSGTVHLALTDGENGSVHGDGAVEGSQTLTSVTGCGTPPPSGTTAYGCCVPPAPLTGSTSALEFTGTQPGASGSTWIYRFVGSLSGDTVTGTFTLTVHFPPPTPADATMSGVVTLR